MASVSGGLLEDSDESFDVVSWGLMEGILHANALSKTESNRVPA